jgi:hypothetical protein
MYYETILYRMYDRVVISVDSEAREWRAYPEEGREATIVGIESYECWVGRIFELGLRPGKYRRNSGSFWLRFDDGTGVCLPTYNFKLKDPALHEQRQAERRNNDLDDPDTSIWLEELPELPFYELDKVQSIRQGRAGGYFDDAFGVIEYIEYRDINEKCLDGVTPMPIYRVEFERRGRATFRAEDLKLVSRGNVWHMQHNEPLVFSGGLEEEVRFQIALGRAPEVRCPETSNYKWPTLGSVEKGLIDDIIDGFATPRGMFGGSTSGHHCHRFQDRDVGERCRRHTLKLVKELIKKHGAEYEAHR